MIGWRIVPGHREYSAFTGEGARLYGGRWNSRGIAAVYTSQHLSLAALELLVHRPTNHWAEDFIAFQAEWDDGQVEYLERAQMPANWRVEPPSLTLQQMGDAWFRAGRKPVLAVPSVVVPREFNYVLNPQHSGFKKIRISPGELFQLDPRFAIPPPHRN